MIYPIQIYKVCSRQTGKQYFLATLQADNDSVTNGLLLLVSVDKFEIQLAMAAHDEYQLGMNDGATIRARRENERQNRNDLAGIAIDDSQPSYHPACFPFPFLDLDARGLADAVQKIEINDFWNLGGKVVDLRE